MSTIRVHELDVQNDQVNLDELAKIADKLLRECTTGGRTRKRKRKLKGGVHVQATLLYILMIFSSVAGLLHLPQSDYDTYIASIENLPSGTSVSYTHLTLPTKRIV